MVDFDANAKQASAIAHRDGPALVIAGAGTGKTEVITQRIARLIEEKRAEPSEIYAITFTDKAAKEMEYRVTEILDRYVLDVNITTFNSFGHDLLQKYAFELGLSPELKLINESQKSIFLRQYLNELKLNYYAPVTNPYHFLSALGAYFSKLKSELILPKQYAKFVELLRKKATTKAHSLEVGRHTELLHAYQMYEKLKLKANLIDFDDQVTLSIDLLDSKANIRSEVTNNIKYLLIDEFQDTNTAQSVLVNLLVGKNNNIMAVGDDDQSIYRFRGAAVANVLNFLHTYPTAKQISLVENYRSGQQILDSAYRLIKHNPNRLEDGEGINKRLRGQFVGKPVELKTFLSIDEEASWIAKDISQKLSAGKPPGEIAVLMRKNAQAKILEKHLDKVNVDYLTIGQAENLYYYPEIRAVIDFLKTVSDPGDSESLYKLLTSPIYEISAAWLREHVSSTKARNVSLEAELKTVVNSTQGRNEKIVQKFLSNLQGWRKSLPKISVGQLAHNFLENSGYIKKLLVGAKDNPQKVLAVNNLNRFFSTLSEFISVSKDPSATAYLDALEAIADGAERLDLDDLPEIYGDKIKLLTIHKAKGLEFETVYIFDLSQGVLPSRQLNFGLELPDELLPKQIRVLQNPHLQEERRLMYVAMTRAKKNLYFTYSPDHGTKRPKQASQFIREALGDVAIMEAIKLPNINTNQIELFKEKASRKATEKTNSVLPAHLKDGADVRLTARQVEDYLQCPREFYLRHILSPPEPKVFALEYGSLMHAIIQQFNRSRLQGKTLSTKELVLLLTKYWPKEGFVSKAHEIRSLEHAKKTLRKFWQRESKLSRMPKLIEESFEFRVPEANLRVRGRFDAVYIEKNEAEVRDYKTGSFRVSDQAKANKKAKDSSQLSIYALAWQLLNGRLPEQVSLDFIDSGIVGVAAKTDRQISSLKEKLHTVAEGIRSGKFEPANSHKYCKHPEYGM